MNELAIHGGPPQNPQGAPPWPPADDAVRAALLQAYASGEWGRYESPTVTRVEEHVAALTQSGQAMLCSSGTVAVEIGLRSLLVGPGDEVILAGYDFGANFRAVEATGARPVLVDITPHNRAINHEQFAAAASPAVKAVLVSHLHGGLADMQAICRAAGQHGWKVLEDACQAHGAVVQGKPAGAWGDVGVTSFGGSKLVTAGRGGAVFTSCQHTFQRARIANDRGNLAYPLSSLQAAVIEPQLAALQERHERRTEAVARLRRNLEGVDCLEPVSNAGIAGEPAYYKHAWRYDADRCGGVPRETFCAAVRAEGVALNAGFRGFANRSTRRCRRPVELPHSKDAAASTVLLHHPVLLQSGAQIDTAALAIAKVYHALCNGDLSGD